MTVIGSAVLMARNTWSRLLRPGKQRGYIGFVGHANLGDEVMLEAAHALLGEQLEPLATPTVEKLLALTPLGGNPRYPFAVLGGGTLVNQGYIGIVETCLEKGIRLATLGTGVGSPGLSAHDSDLDPRWVEALRQFEGVGVRGPLSAAKLTAVGVAKTKVIGDLALALTPDLPCGDPVAKTLLFNTTRGRTRGDQILLERFDTAMAGHMRRLIAEGWRILPVAFHEDDVEPIRRTLAASELVNPTIESPTSFRAYTDLASKVTLSVSVRLHGSVLASMCGIPNLLLGYRSKCEDFCASIGAEEAVVGFADFSESELARKLNLLLEQRHVAGQPLHRACLDYREKLQSYVDAISRGVEK